MSSVNKETKLIKFVKRTLNVIKKARIPLRSSKYSNQIYSNHIHLVLLVLKIKSGMSYEEFMEWTENFPGLWEVLQTENIPHFTTIHKFAGRFPRRYLDMVISASSIENDVWSINTAIDSTGFSMTNASYYYTFVIERRRKKGKRGRPCKRRAIRRHLKATFVVETNSQMVIAAAIRRGPDNDNKDFIPLYRKMSRLDKRMLDRALADKGYDSESNHAYIRDVLGADTIIPARKNRSSDYRTRGRYRREMRAGYSKEQYYQRNMVETANSVIKRKMGDGVMAKKCLYQNREIFFKVIAYNIERGLKITLFVIEGFLESRRDAAKAEHRHGSYL